MKDKSRHRKEDGKNKGEIGRRTLEERKEEGGTRLINLRKGEKK